MIRISLPFFTRLGAALQGLNEIKGGTSTVADSILPLLTAQSEVEGLLQTDWFSPAIRTASIPGHALVAAIKQISSRTDYEAVLSMGDVWGINAKLSEFRTVLNAELGIADCYFVSRKSAYDTYSLITAGEKCFPQDLPLKVPAAISDLREAAKCIAFEVPTASGFHIMRGLEAVIRGYWPVASGGKQHPKNKTMGGYIKSLRDKNYGTPKVRAVLSQIKDLHRNPLAHPDVTLDMPEAISLFGICESAIAAMLKEMPVPPDALVLTTPVASP